MSKKRIHMHDCGCTCEEKSKAGSLIVIEHKKLTPCFEHWAMDQGLKFAKDVFLTNNHSTNILSFRIGRIMVTWHSCI